MTETSPVIYLDTQDYSRFGSVVEGRGNDADRKLFLRLKGMAESGQAVFACSAPIMSELLSYDETLPHISEAKAEAVEALCRGHALVFPNELIALEVSRLAEAEGMIAPQQVRSVLSSEYGWFPDVGDIFVDMRKRLLDEGDRQIGELVGVNREARRKAKRMMQKLDLGRAITEATPELAKKYGFPPSAVEQSAGLFLRGKISSQEASKRLFSTIATPTNFVRAYFQGYEGEKTLPDWIASAGRTLGEALGKFQGIIARYPTRNAEETRLLRRLIEENAPTLAAIVLKGATEDAPKFGVPIETLAVIRERPELVARVDAANVVGRLFCAYISQTAGLSGSVAKVELSFGGDIMHSIYLSHVDLWRADRRFGHVAATALKDRSSKIITRLGELPDRIERWHRSQPRP